MLAHASLIASVPSTVAPTAIIEQVSQTVLTAPGISQSTAVKKYGSSSITSNGTSSLEYYYPVGFQSSSQSATMEAWVYRSSTATGAWHARLNNQTNGGGQSFYYFSNVVSGVPRVSFGGLNTTASFAQQSGSTAFAADTWTHIVIWSSATNYTGWVNGVISGANNSIWGTGTTNYQQIVTKFYVELLGWKQFSQYTTGIYMDDIRISSGNRYNNTNFTPPTSRLTVDATTLALIQSI